MGTGQAPTREHERLFAQLEQEHQRAEQLAAELEATFAAISDAIIVYDVQGIPVRANPAAISVCGIDPVGMDRAILASQLSIRRDHAHGISVRAVSPKVPGGRSGLLFRQNQRI